MLSEALTVTELTRNIKHLLEGNFGQVLLQGELSNLARPHSGHLYFNVKDDQAQIAGVMFRSAAQRCRFELENGLEVLLKGRISVYEPRGTYQIIVERIDPLGAGALQLAFEQLKAKLAAEGLFASELKKEIPFLPKGIGVVTSPTGAAIRDILTVLQRRFPGIPVLINPVSVQGESAAREIARAIEQFQSIPDVDVLIVGRGGGSIEDLWSFNEEIVARAIHASTIPIISAVGHETDFTIADFVADLRAPTPSAAAELAVPLLDDLLDRVGEHRSRLTALLQRQMKFHGERLNQFHKRLRSPEWVIQSHAQKLDDLTGRLRQGMEHQLIVAKHHRHTLAQRLLHQSPQRGIETVNNRLSVLEQRLQTALRSLLEKKQSRVLELAHVLDSMSPLAVMNRGYAAVTDADNRTVRSVNQVGKGDNISVHVSDGIIKSTAIKVIPKTINPVD